MRFEVFMAARMMIMFFWVLMLCDLLVDANVSEKHTVSIFSPEDGDIMFLKNVRIYRRVYRAPKPRITTSSGKFKYTDCH
jgi:hypothetical protein